MVNYKKIGAVVGAIALVASLGVNAVQMDGNSDLKDINEELQTSIDSTNITVEPTIEIVEVDNANLDLVLQHISDNEGNVEYLTDDLNDDEVEQIVSRILTINEAKALASSEVKNELADELDGSKTVTLLNGTDVTIDFDEDDIERVNVQDDDDELIITRTDFEDDEVDVEGIVRFKYDDVNYEADFMVEIDKGDVDDLKISNIRER